MAVGFPQGLKSLSCVSVQKPDFVQHLDDQGQCGHGQESGSGQGSSQVLSKELPHLEAFQPVIYTCSLITENRYDPSAWGIHS